MLPVRRALSLFGMRPAAAEPLAEAAKAEPRLRAALADLAHGRAEPALAAFDELLSDAAMPARLRAQIENKRGVALVRLGRRGEALAAFVAATRVDERCAPALVNLGNLLVEDGAALDAIDFYTEATEADATYAPAYRGLGVAYKRLGRRGEAVRALRAEGRHGVRRRA